MDETIVVDPGLLFVGAILLLAAGIVSIHAIRELWPALQILRNEPLDVQDLSYHSGPAEVTGTAQGDEKAVRAPFTGSVCLAYEYEAQELKSSGKNSSWQTLDEGSDAVTVLLEDETGTVEVDAPAAELHLSSDTLELDPGDQPPDRITQYIRATDDVDLQDGSVDLVVTELNYGNRQKFIERRLDVSESIHVYGAVEDAPPGEWGSGQVDAVLTSDENTPLVLSDASERETAWRVGTSRLLWPGLATALACAGLYFVWLGLGESLVL